MTYNIGARPGKGIYRCLGCNWTVVLDEESDRLPPCDRCGRGQRVRYIRIGVL